VAEVAILALGQGLNLQAWCWGRQSSQETQTALQSLRAEIGPGLLCSKPIQAASNSIIKSDREQKADIF
jgi:hypothetical protein